MSCKGCTERHVGCHSTCPEYTEWKSKRERMNEAIWKQKRAEAGLIESKVKQCEKVRRKKKRW